jgi:hypothetical protein
MTSLKKHLAKQKLSQICDSLKTLLYIILGNKNAHTNWVIRKYFLDLSKFYDFKWSTYKYTSKRYDSNNNYFNTFSKKL